MLPVGGLLRDRAEEVPGGKGDPELTEENVSALLLNIKYKWKTSLRNLSVVTCRMILEYAAKVVAPESLMA